MAITKKLLKVVKRKFPEQDERIKVLFETSEDFRSLCSDYVLCLLYLQKFKEESSQKRLTIREFSEVRTELEDELSQFILSR